MKRMFNLRAMAAALVMLPTLIGSAALASGQGPARATGFDFRVEMLKAEVPRWTLESQAETTTSLTSDADLGDVVLTARTKGLSDDSGSLMVELYLENRLATPLENVTLNLDAATSSGIFDLTQDAYNTVPLAEPFKLPVGRLAGYGMKRVVLGVPKGFAPEVRGIVTADLSSGEGQSTTNIVVSADGAELWAVSQDSGEVVAYSLPGRTELARIKVGAEPSSLAIQNSRNWVVVASGRGNTVTVIDRAAKKVLNVLGTGEEFGRELRQLIVAQNSPTIYVTSYVEGILSKLVLDGNAQLVDTGTVVVGPHPTGMSMTADEAYLYVAHFLPRGSVRNNESWISVVDLKAFKKSGEGIVEDHFNPENPRMKCLADFYNSYPFGRLLFGGDLKPTDMSLEGVASQFYGVFLDPSGQTAWVPGTRITGALVVLERGPKADPSLKRFGGLAPGQLVAPLLFPMDARDPSALKPMYTRDIEMAIPTLKGAVKCMRHPLEIEFIDRYLEESSHEQSNPFLAYGVPHAGLTGLGLVNTIAFTKGGRMALMISHVSDELAVYDATTINPASQLHLPLSGATPRGLTLSPDKKRAYVLYENSGFISEIDVSAYSPDDSAALPKPYELPYRYAPTSQNLIQLGGVVGLPLIRNVSQVAERPKAKEVAQIPLWKNDELSPAMRRGKILFNAANPEKYTVSLNRLGACASCHPGGGNDGSSWVTMEGSRRTLSLRGGVESRGWLHSSATHKDAREFVEIIVPERLGGHLPPADYDALALYVGKGIPKLQSPRVDQVLAKKGEALFGVYCQGCHSGPDHTSGLKPDGEARIFNIGTASANHGVASGRFSNTLIGFADSGSKEIAEALVGDRPLGPGDPIQKILDFRQRPVRAMGEFKAPSLVNAFDNPVFFHDASVDNLRDAIARISSLLKLGLTDEQLSALEAYVKTL